MVGSSRDLFPPGPSFLTAHSSSWPLSAFPGRGKHTELSEAPYPVRFCSFVHKRPLTSNLPDQQPLLFLKEPDILVFRALRSWISGKQHACLVHSSYQALTKGAERRHKLHKKRELTCLRLENLLIPLVTVGKCLKIKIKTPTLLVLVNSRGVNTPPWLTQLTQLALLALKNWDHKLFLTGQCTGLEPLPWSLSMRQVEP